MALPEILSEADIDLEDIIRSFEPRKTLVLNAPVHGLVRLTRTFGSSSDKLVFQGLSI